MSSLLKIVKESGINFSGSLVGMVLNYVLLMVLTRFLTPEEYGTFVLAQSVINVSLIFVLFGTPKALDRFIPYYNASGEQGKSKTLIYDLLKFTLILSLVVGFVIFTESGFLSYSLFKKPNLALVLKIIVLSVPMLAFIQLVSFAFIGLKELRYQVYLQQLALPLLKIGLATSVFAMGYGLFGWAWMYVLSLVAASILALWFFKEHLITSLSKVKKIPISFSEIASYSWPLSINNIILIFLGQIDFLFLGYFRPSAEIGIYRIYIYLVAISGLVLSSFAQIYKPVISELISKEKIEEIGETYRRVSKWIFLINAFGLLVFLIFGTHIVRILFTESYLIAPTALFILAGGRFLNSSFGPEGMTLEALGNTKLSMFNSLIMLGTNVGLDYFLIPRYGIIGAAIATASSITLGGLAGLVEIYLLYRLQPFNLGYVKYAAVALIPGCIVYITTHQLNNLSLIGLVGLVVLLAMMYTAGLYYSRSFDSVDYHVLQWIGIRLMEAKNLTARGGDVGK